MVATEGATTQQPGPKGDGHGCARGGGRGRMVYLALDFRLKKLRVKKGKAFKF